MQDKKKFSLSNILCSSLVLLFISSYSLIGQESGAQTNVQGKDVSQLKHTWAAQWITHPSAPTMEYGVFLFRRTFDLLYKPKYFKIYVSADNRYRLFVNGHEVSNGPARGDINNWRYEELDISEYLNKGHNVIAAHVTNFGEFRHAAQSTFQTAFILQGDDVNEVNIDTKPDVGWKVYHDTAYGYTPFTSDSVGGYYAAGPGDIFTAREHPWGWESDSFDDSSWSVPRPATVEFAVGRGFLFGSTWFLVPRTIPPMTNIPTRITKVVRAKGLELPNHIFSGEQEITIPPQSKVSILLDQGYHTIGHPQLRFSDGRDSKIKITYSEALFYKDSESFSAHGGWLKGHRNQDYDKKEARGYYDIIHPDGGANRTYKPLALRVYRFIKFDITTADQALKLDDFIGHYSTYPFEEKSSFECDNDSLELIWDVAWRTLRNSSVETFLDPYYEQLQYIGDSRIQAMVALYVADDDKLMKKAISSFDDSRLPMGLTASRFPSYIVQIIPTYSLIWIGIMNDFLMYRDEPEYLEQFVPGILSVLAWFERHLDETNMLTNLEWWNFTDWSAGFDNGIPPGADDGHSANVSLQYVYAIQNAIPILRKFQYDYEANKYEEIAEKIKAGVLSLCQNNQNMLIAERPEKDIYSQHTNIWGVLTNTFSPLKEKEVMKLVLEDESLIQSSIYFKFYLVKALQKVGLGDRYMEQLEPWKYMLNQGMTTFGETDKNPRSDCHGWSATPCYDFIHTITGIQPASQGFRTVLIEPNFNSLNHINTQFQHPKGKVIVELNKSKEGNISGKVILPQGVKGSFRYKEYRQDLDDITIINI